MINKRIILLLAAVIATGSLYLIFNTDRTETKAGSEDIEITMYRGEACNCCVKWADYLKENGFRVIDRPVDNLLEIKTENHVSSDLASCHTALIDGYVVEGHVPSREILRMLSERPNAAGISVPGMPLGSPGMNSFRSDPYEVILFDDSGNQSVFAQY